VAADHSFIGQLVVLALKEDMIYVLVVVAVALWCVVRHTRRE
jgi:hypothetical protein